MTMERLQGTTQVLRKAGLITLIGFLAVILSGPVLTVLGILLPFALVGLLVWIPFRAFVAAKHGGLPEVGQQAKTALRNVAAVPVWILGTAFALVGFVLKTGWGIVAFLLGIIFPTIAGAFLGGVLGLIGGIEHNDAEVRVPAGAAIGASIGLIAGAWRTKPAKQVVIIERVPVERGPEALQRA
jgi:hypothetical protein